MYGMENNVEISAAPGVMLWDQSRLSDKDMTESKWWLSLGHANISHDFRPQRQFRLQDAKSVEEKAAKIKEWVMLKLSEVTKWEP